MALIAYLWNSQSKFEVMSKIKWGALVVDGRGKLGGHVLTKTRSGATIRTKVTPVNPQTAAQAAARSRLGGNSQAWKTLSEEDRRGWNEAAQQSAKTNVFGDQYFPTGKNLFTGLNSNLMLIGVTPLVTAPELQSVPVITELNVAITRTPFAVTITGQFEGSLPAASVVVEATTPLSVGVFNPSGKFRFIKFDDAADLSTGIDLTAGYENKFGIPANGKKIFFRAYAVSKETGESSPKFVTQGIV